MVLRSMEGELQWEKLQWEGGDENESFCFNLRTYLNLYAGLWSLAIKNKIEFKIVMDIKNKI